MEASQRDEGRIGALGTQWCTTGALNGPPGDTPEGLNTPVIENRTIDWSG